MLRSRMGLLSKGLFFMVIAMCFGLLISYIYSQFTYKTADAFGIKVPRLIINQGAAIVSIDITNATLNMSSNRITNVANPTAPQDAATKDYVDGKSFVPSGAILMLESNSSCPSGYTEVTTTYNLRFPIACNTTIGGLDCTTAVRTGGNLDHTHGTLTISGSTAIANIPHSHTVSSGWSGTLHGSGGHGAGSYYCFGANNPTSVSTSSVDPGGGHSHGAGGLTISPMNPANPPYFTVKLCKKN